MNTLNTQLQKLLLDAIVGVLIDFDVELEIDSSLEVSSKKVPMIHVKNELQMEYLQNEKNNTLVIFQHNFLAEYINRYAEDDGLGFLFENAIVSLVKYHDDGSIKLFIEAHSGGNEIADVSRLANLGIDADLVFETIDSLIRSEDPDIFHSHADINAALNEQ